MKKFGSIIFVFLLFSTLQIKAQCTLNAGPDTNIVCGEFITLNPEANWKHLNSGTGQTLNSAWFTNEPTGYIAADSGIILKTTNGGNTFSFQSSGTTNNLKGIRFMLPNTGIAVGYNGTILKTTNGGINWFPQSSGTSYNLNAVFSLNASRIYAVGNNGTLLRSNDSGTTWTTQTSTVSWNLQSVYFTDSLHGFVIGNNGGILKTSNGGTTWGIKYSQANFNFYSVYFTSADTGYVSGIAGVAFILKTTDAGETWNPLISGISGGTLFFTSKKTVYLTAGAIYKSYNAGSTWKQLSGAPFMSMRSVFFPTETTGFSIGLWGEVWRYQAPDSCRWSPSAGLSDSTALNPVVRALETTTYFLTAKVNACVLTDNLTVMVNPLTVNIGNTLTFSCGDTLRLNAQTNIAGESKLHFQWYPGGLLNNDTLANPILIPRTQTTFVVIANGANGCLATDTLLVNPDFSMNAGPDLSVLCSKAVQLGTKSSWTKLSNIPLFSLSHVQMPGRDTGFITSSNGFLKTTNGGTSWTQSSPGINLHPNDVFFRNGQLGYAAAFNSLPMCGVVLKTTDGGNSWATQTIGGCYSIPSIWFTGDLTGYAIANPGKILRTVNGGDSWIPVNSTSTQNLNSIFFASASTGYAVGLNGTILKTINSGLSWSAQTSGTSASLTAVFFTSVDTGFAVGSNSVVLKTINGGTNWTLLSINPSSGVTYDVNSIYFTDASTGYAACSYFLMPNPQYFGALFKTTNGGFSWERMSCDTNYRLNAVFFSPNKSGYAVGVNGTIMRTPIAPDSYLWSPASGLSSSNIENPYAGPATTTQYVVTGSKNNCYVKDTITVLVKSLVISGGNDQSVVCGDSAKLIHHNVYVEMDASRSGSEWTLRDSLNQILLQSKPETITKEYIYLPDGKYTVRLRPQITPPPLRIRIIPFANDSLSELINFSADSIILRYFTVSSLSKYSFSWTPSQTLVGPATPIRQYFLNMSSTEGCTAKDTIQVIPQSLSAYAGIDKTATCGTFIQLDTLQTNYTGKGVLSYQYSPGISLNDSTRFNPVSKTKVNTAYKVKVVTTNGCVAFDTVQVTIQPLSVTAFDTTLFCNDQTPLRIQTNYGGKDSLQYIWSPTTNLDNANKAQPLMRALVPIHYQIRIETSNACVATDSLQIQLRNPLPENICLVGVNALNQNQIIWNKGIKGAIDSFLVRRETNTTGIYQTIGKRGYNNTLIFTDTTAKPQVQSNKYILITKDICGLTSNASPPHTTMHLSINKGTGNIWNLQWNSYEGVMVSTYNVYRGTDTSSLILIGTSSGSNTSYSDLTAPAGDVYYQVELISSNTCFPGKSYNSSRSNKASNTYLGMNNHYSGSLTFKVYPNPASDILSIDLGNQVQNAVITIFDVQGRNVQCVNQGQRLMNLDISELPKGVYFVEIKNETEGSVTKMIKE